MSETLKAWLVAISEPTIVIIDAIAFVWIVVGVVYLIVGALRALLSGASSQDKRVIWLGFAKVLVAALSLQLAADIIESSISMSWEAIGRLGAVAVIRTFLDYFLSRDVEEVRERQERRGAGEARQR
ncbi:MAG TPA: DUF1622 domain-containing protein [Gammaproteobacteria bacterium]|nr:DUF1622 domain-containing protein [Gammaproteobacteria bacterium]